MAVGGDCAALKSRSVSSSKQPVLMRYRRPILLLVIAALLPLVILASGLGVAWLLQQHETIQNEASGLEIAREIRTRYPGLPVVLMTGYSEALLKGSPEGLPVLAKPFSSSDLETILQQMHGRQAEAAI